MKSTGKQNCYVRRAETFVSFASRTDSVENSILAEFAQQLVEVRMKMLRYRAWWYDSMHGAVWMPWGNRGRLQHRARSGSALQIPTDNSLYLLLTPNHTTNWIWQYFRKILFQIKLQNVTIFRPISLLKALQRRLISLDNDGFVGFSMSYELLARHSEREI